MSFGRLRIIQGKAAQPWARHVQPFSNIAPCHCSTRVTTSLEGTQSTALALEPIADEAGRMRFRLAPNDVAGAAAKVDGHLGNGGRP